MDFKIKRPALLAALLLCLAACSQRYELALPLSLNREEMRFESGGSSYYVLVYSRGPWTASLERDVPWLSLSRTSGEGNSQIMVTADLNNGVSRGVTLIISGSEGTREMYISQKAGLSEGGNYGFVKEAVELLRDASSAQIMAGTNLDETTIAGAQSSVVYGTPDEDWIHDISVSATRVTFRVDANTSGADRKATVNISFPLARWDTPVTSFFQVRQSTAEPEEVTVTLSPLSGRSLSWAGDERLLLLDSDGSGTTPAFVSDGAGSGSATFLFNKEAIKGGIAAAVYPEDFVSRQSGGKVYLTVPAEQEASGAPEKASDLVCLFGRMEGGQISLRAAGSVLKLNINGEGTLQSLSLTAEVPVAGDGTIDLGAAEPGFEPLASGSSELKLALPSGGLSLPAELYVSVPATGLGRISLAATTDRWSGSITCNSAVSAPLNEIVPVEEFSLTLPPGAENLSEGGKWANCYLIEDPAEKVYVIDLCKPDGSLPSGELVRCGYLWQTAPNVLTSLAIDANAGKLYFRKGANLPGSAHVAVMDADGTVRWSWHIWAPAEPVEGRRIGSWTFMDRNVGAVRAAATDYSNASIGMHYQWGRKDPFPPAGATAASGHANHGAVYPDNISFTVAQDGVPQEVADAHPATWYWGSGATGKEDWRDVQDDGLWTGARTNADPCPYGWAVAPKAAMDELPARLKAAQYVSRVGITIQDDDGKSMLFVPGGYYRRSTNASSQICNMADGWIWVATPVEMGTNRGSYRLWFQSNVNNRRVDTTYPQRRWGGNVRCVKIQ